VESGRYEEESRIFLCRLYPIKNLKLRHQMVDSYSNSSIVNYCHIQL